MQNQVYEIYGCSVVEHDGVAVAETCADEEHGGTEAQDKIYEMYGCSFLEQSENESNGNDYDLGVSDDTTDNYKDYGYELDDSGYEEFRSDDFSSGLDD